MDQALTDDGPSRGDLRARRVLVLHNRYRQVGGEERYVAQLHALLERETDAAILLERSSSESNGLSAARSLLRGGSAPDEIAEIVAREQIDVVHAHNIWPLFGWRGLAAARDAGAAVVLHLHNFRIFCAIGTAFREGSDCVECAPRNMRAGVRHNCRGSLPQAAAYAAGLQRGQQPTIDAVDRFVAPVDQVGRDLTELGLDLDVATLPSWLDESEFVTQSQCGDGEYALYVGRVTEDKGVLVAIAASAESGVPLRVAGLGPDIREAQTLAEALEAPVDFLGRLDGQALVAARMGAAFALVPSIWREVLPLAALESLAAGLPLLTSDRGGLPELTDADLVSPAGDTHALAATMERMFTDRSARAEAGARALKRARTRFSEAAYLPRLAELYADAITARND